MGIEITKTDVTRRDALIDDLRLELRILADIGDRLIEDLQHRTVKHIKEEHHEEEVIQDPSKAGKKAQ